MCRRFLLLPQLCSKFHCLAAHLCLQPQEHFNVPINHSPISFPFWVPCSLLPTLLPLPLTPIWPSLFSPSSCWSRIHVLVEGTAPGYAWQAQQNEAHLTKETCWAQLARRQQDGTGGGGGGRLAFQGEVPGLLPPSMRSDSLQTMEGLPDQWDATVAPWVKFGTCRKHCVGSW